MTTLANVARPARVTDVGWIDWLLSVLVGATAIATVTAVVLGRDEWNLVPAMVWVHLGSGPVSCAFEASKWQSYRREMTAAGSHAACQGNSLRERSHFDVRRI